MTPLSDWIRVPFLASYCIQTASTGLQRRSDGHHRQVLSGPVLHGPLACEPAGAMGARRVRGQRRQVRAGQQAQPQQRAPHRHRQAPSHWVRAVKQLHVSNTKW